MKPDGVLDLGKLREQADARDAALKDIEEQRALTEAKQVAVEWDAKMNRAFKGIVSRPQRHALLRRIPEPEAVDAD